MACNGKGVCALGSKLKTPISTFPVLARHEFSNPAITFPRLVVFLAQWYGENMQKTFDNVWEKISLKTCLSSIMSLLSGPASDELDGLQDSSLA